MATKMAGTTLAEKDRLRRHVDEYSEVMRKEVPCKRHNSAFLPKPKRLTIDIQAESEQIVLVLRQHVITQTKSVFIVVALLLLPLLFSATQIFSFLPLTYRFGSMMGWYLFTAGFSLECYLKWFYRVFIVTDERIIDVDFNSMIYKDVSTTKIDKIEDITAITSGFFSSIFDYGTVIIQTAGTKQELEFEDIPQPAKVTALLNEMILEEELEKFEGRVN
ncbi:PH domain-containing protein [Patescibacteria group bacterium]|nr:PH domain-containing protein [Patescibacteria group bacterium]